MKKKERETKEARKGQRLKVGKKEIKEERNEKVRKERKEVRNEGGKW